MAGSGGGSVRPANEVGENNEAAVAAAATLYNCNGLKGYSGSEWRYTLREYQVHRCFRETVVVVGRADYRDPSPREWWGW